jgi:2'-5' RNA ligase
MTTIRTFIAVELSDEARTALADLQKRLKDAVPPKTVRWTRPQNIHLTLHFLGDVAKSDITQVADALQQSTATYPPFLLRLSGLGCFPNMRRPRIVWAGVTGDTASLVKLHRDLGQRLQVIDFKPDTRPYSPHLTIGRVKRGLPGPELVELGDRLEQVKSEVAELAPLPVRQIGLIKSDLKPTGAVYTPLAHGILKSETG